MKFTPVITTDSMSKNGISHSISARHCCIASMKEYETKSYEELRFEDYQVGRKGAFYLLNLIKINYKYNVNIIFFLLFIK